MGNQQLYRQIRAAFTLQHTSLNAWCRQHQVTRQYAERVLQGYTNGPDAKVLLRRIAKAAGVKLKKNPKANQPNPSLN